MDQITDLMIYGSCGDIEALRRRVLNRLGKFDGELLKRADILYDSRCFLYFEKDIDQFISLIDELIAEVEEDNVDNLDNIQAKICKHEDIEAEISIRGIEMNNLEELGLQMIVDNNPNSEIIRSRICEMKEKWQTLLAKLTDQMEILRTKQCYIEYLRCYEKIMLWIDKKMNLLTKRNYFKSLESIEEYVHNFKLIEKKIFRMECEIDDLKSTSDFFIKDDFPESYNVSQKKQKLIYSWTILKDVISSKRLQLVEFIRIHKLCCRVNEFIAWMARKETVFSVEDCGKNLEEFMVLQKKHQGMEKLLDEIETRLDEILDEHDSLRVALENHTEGVLVAREIIEQKWQDLELKATKRRMMLQLHARILRYLIEINTTIQNLDGIKTVISREDFTKNVEDPESCLKLLSLFKNAVSARNDDLDHTFKRGYDLLKIGLRTNELTAKLEELDKSKKSVHDVLEFRKKKFNLQLDLQHFHHDCEVVANWLTQKEARLVLDEDRLNSLDVVHAELENHHRFEEIFQKEKRRMWFLIHFNPGVSVENESETSELLEKKKELGSKLESLQYKFKQRRRTLEGALKLQYFYADCVDIEKWMIVKLRIISDDYYLDGSIINGSIATHGLFLDEFINNSKIVNALLDREKEFIRENHNAAHAVKERLAKLIQAWNSLSFETYDKTLVLENILDVQTFLLGSTKLEFQLGEYEEILSNQYVFHDGEMSSVLRVEDNLVELEREVRVIKRRVDNMRIIGNKLIRKRHYSSEKIAERITNICKQHRDLTNTIKTKMQTIKEARDAGELFMEMEEQVTWMDQKISDLRVINTEQGLLDVTRLRSKSKTCRINLNVRTKEVSKITTAARKMIAGNHYDKEEIAERLDILVKTWNQLKNVYREHVLRLKEANRIYDYFAEAELHEAIIQEKLVVMCDADYGANEDSSAALLKRHEVIVADFKAYGKKVKALRKRANSWRRLPLSVTAVYQRDPVSAEKDYIAQEPDQLTITKGEQLIVVNSTDAVWWKVEKGGQQGLVPKECIRKRFNSDPECPLFKRQAELEMLYSDLMSLAEERKHNIQNTLKAFTILRETSEMLAWIEEKGSVAREVDVGENIVQVEILQKKFDDFQSDLAERRVKIIGMLTKTEKIHPYLQQDLAESLFFKTEDLKCAIKNLQEQAKIRETQLNSAHELQRFYRDMDEAEEWMKEKYKFLDSEDCGDSLRAIRTLLRKHEGLERDLDALDDKINELNEVTEYLTEKYPESADDIMIKQIGINERWEEISEKSILRKQDLLDSYDLHKFFSDYDHLMSWIRKMMPLVSSEERPSDVHSAQTLVSNFERIASEIEQHEIEIQIVQKFGEMLIHASLIARNDIGNKLKELKQASTLLFQKKTTRKLMLEENLEVNVFLRDCDNMDRWLADKEALLNATGDNEQLIKIHKKIEESIQGKQNYMLALQGVAIELIQHCPHDIDRISTRYVEIIYRWDNLRDAHSAKRLQLTETQTLQQFSLEAAEIEYWIDDKLQQATRETYRDPVNIKSKLLKHEAFASEIEANSKRVEIVLNNGHELLETEKSEKLKLAVQERLEKISSQWHYLQTKTEETSEKLKQVSKQYDHIIGIKYMNFWMGDIETFLMNKDIGKGLDSVQNLLGQHKVIEEDIASHWGKIQDLQKEVDMFTSDSIFDIVSISEEHKNMISRYQRIKELAAQRRIRLDEKNTVFHYLKEIDETEARMRETALRMDEQIQPTFECDKIKPTFKFRKEKVTPSGGISKAEERAELIEKLLNL